MGGGLGSFFCWVKMAEEEVVAGEKPKSKPAKPFTESETEQLISLWQEEEILFNCRHQNYFNRDERRNAINRVLAKFEKLKEGETVNSA